MLFDAAAAAAAAAAGVDGLLPPVLTLLSDDIESMRKVSRPDSDSALPNKCVVLWLPPWMDDHELLLGESAGALLAAAMAAARCIA